MDPATLSLIMAGLGGASQIIGTPGSTTGNPADVTNINQGNTDQMIQQLQALLSGSQQQTDQYAGQASGQFNALQAAGQQGLNQANVQLGQGFSNANQGYNALTSLQGQLGSQAAYDPNAGTALFQQNAPIYQDLASQARTEALSQFENPAATQALLEANNNVSTVANNFANMGSATSGAAAAAAAQGAQAPLAQLAVDRANLANSAYSSTLNPLLQQGQALASQDAQYSYDSGIQNLLQQISAASQQGQLGLGQASAANQAASNATNQLGTSAQGMAGLSSLYAGLQGGALSGLSSLSAPEYYSPTYTPATGLFGMFG